LNLVNYRELSIIFAEIIDKWRNHRLSITIIFDSPTLVTVLLRPLALGSFCVRLAFSPEAA
jgi:hypothetical protein